VKRLFGSIVVSLIVFALLCGSIAANAAEGNCPDWESDLSHGRAACQTGKYAEAETFFSRAAAESIDQTQAATAYRDLLWMQITRWTVANGEPPPNEVTFAVLAAYQVGVDAHDPASLFSQALVQRTMAVVDAANAKASLSAALDLLAQGLALSPDDAAAYWLRASVYGELGEQQRALEDFNKSIDRAPKSKIAFEGRSNVYLKLGKQELAESDKRTAQSIDNRTR